MYYLTLHHWSNFQTILTILGGAQAKKPSKSSLKGQFLLVQKHLKIENSGTTNPISMEFTQYMYHLNTFSYSKLGVWIEERQGAHPSEFEYIY